MDSNTNTLLSHMGGPDFFDMFGSEEDGTMQDNNPFFTSAMDFSASDHPFGSLSLATSPLSPNDLAKEQPIPDSNTADTQHNPTSLRYTSSRGSGSDSSVNRGRNSLSDSSTSDLLHGDLAMEDAGPSDNWKNTSSTFKQEKATNSVHDENANLDNFETSNRLMEKDFDFDSAANSPHSIPTTNSTEYSGPRHVTIPVKTSSISAASPSESNVSWVSAKILWY
jgi:hypothetical protein